MGIIDHLENHLSLYHRALSQTCGEERGLNSLKVDLMLDLSHLEEEDFNQIRGIEITLIIEIGVLRQRQQEMHQLHQEYLLLVDQPKDTLNEK